MSGTIILPTFSGHFSQANNLIETIRKTSGDIPINIIISKDDEKLFRKYKHDEFCEIKYIENLVKDYAGIDISAVKLLKSIGKFRFQALKKILGVLNCNTSLALILDSETNIVKDLNGMFSGGLEKTTVLYTERKWDKIPESLTTDVRTEVNTLLDQQSDNWFFESFNWIYDVELLKKMLLSIESKFGKDWIFRKTPLFECQLYYQYVFNQHTSYSFLRVEDLFIEHFGVGYGNQIINRFWNSSITSYGMIEYAAHLMSKEEYISFISNPKVTHHLRLIRHEPPLIYDIVKAARQKCSVQEYYGEAAMHRGDFTTGKIAVLISGDFYNIDNVLNIKNFLAGVDCDIFVATKKDNHLAPLINEILTPVKIIKTDDELSFGRYSKSLAISDGIAETAIKEGRDIGVSNMFDKLFLAYNAMKEYQFEIPQEYGVVVRVRPDIYSTSRLKDIFYDVAENTQIDQETIFFPNRFWSQGINDQLFFGKMKPMLELLDNLSGEKYIDCEYLNPEYFLGKTILKLNLKPIAIDFNYILMRNQPIEISLVQQKLSEQESAFWSKKIPFICWKDLTNNLESVLNNIYIKNTKLSVSNVFTLKKKSIDYFYGKMHDGKVLVFTSEHKSPYISASKIKKICIPFLSYLLILGYPFSTMSVNNIVLKKYSKEFNELEILKDERLEKVSVFTPKPSVLAWGIVQAAKRVRRLLLKMLRR